MSQYTFYTTQSDLSQYNGTVVEVLGPLPESEYDREDVGPMYRVRLWDGSVIDAFDDELQ